MECNLLGCLIIFLIGITILILQSILYRKKLLKLYDDNDIEIKKNLNNSNLLVDTRLLESTNQIDNILDEKLKIDEPYKIEHGKDE